MLICLVMSICEIALLRQLHFSIESWELLITVLLLSPPVPLDVSCEMKKNAKIRIITFPYF